MKKLLCVVMALAIALTLVGCGGSKPDATVKTFCDGMKKLDIKKMQSCLLDADDLDTSDFESEEMPVEFLKYVKEWASKMTYKVKESKVDGDKATVTVDFKYTDASDVMGATMQDYFAKMIAAAFSGKEYSEEEMSKMLITCLEAALKEKELKKAETTIDISLVKKDNDWKIEEASDELVNVMTSNMIGALEDMMSGFLGGLFE